MYETEKAQCVFVRSYFVLRSFLVFSKLFRFHVIFFSVVVVSKEKRQQQQTWNRAGKNEKETFHQIQFLLRKCVSQNAHIILFNCFATPHPSYMHMLCIVVDIINKNLKGKKRRRKNEKRQHSICQFVIKQYTIHSFVAKNEANQNKRQNNFKCI